MARKKGDSLTDEKRKEIVLARFGQPDKIQSVGVLAKQFKVDPGTIVRATAEAFKRKLVEIRPVQGEIQNPERVRSLEDQLMNRFDGLDNVIVVAEEKDGGADGKADSQASATRAGRVHVHQRLGAAMAAYLKESRIIRNNKVIAVGCGRGVYHTIASLQHGRHRLTAEKVTLVSLNGSLAYASVLEENVPIHPESDNHITLLGYCFENPFSLIFRPMAHPFAYPTHAELEKVRKRTHLDEDKWKKETPDLALVGVGVFSAGNRFYNSVEKGQLSAVGPLAKYLGDLAKACAEVSEGAPRPYVPVGDVCDRLFFVDPPAGFRVQMEKKKKIDKLIHELNQRGLSVNTDQLRLIKTVIAIAGSEEKAGAVHSLLKDDLIKILCTDQRTAQAILAY